VTVSTVLWRRLDQPGHDAARLIEDPDGPRLEGTAVFDEGGQGCRLDYRVVCDPTWQSVSARVVGWIGETAIELAIAADDQRGWTVNGESCPQVAGCLDVDLSFTPATNLLAIRRTQVAVGGRVAVRSAWLDFPRLRLEPLDQVYARLDDTTWHYESNGGSFTARLVTNAAGFVIDYPGLWIRESGD
jgi:hypothetical protein